MDLVLVARWFLVQSIYLQRDRDALAGLADRRRCSPLRTLRANDNEEKKEENVIYFQKRGKMWLLEFKISPK